MDISNNQIDLIGQHAFTNLNNLKHLHLHNNIIKEINLEDLPMNTYVYLTGNPIAGTEGLTGLEVSDPDMFEFQAWTPKTGIS